MSSSKAPKTPDYTGAAIAQGAADKEIAQYLTKANRVNQVDPYGQTTWTQTTTPEQNAAKAAAEAALANYNRMNAQNNWERWQPAEVAKQRAILQKQIDDAKEGQWTQTTTLTPEQQKLLNQQQFIGAMQNDRIAGLIRDTGNPTAPTLGPQRSIQQRDLAIATMAPQRQLKEASPNQIQDLLYGQITKQYGDRFAKEEAAQRAQLANQGFQMGSEGYNTTLNDFTKSKNSAYEDAATQAALASYDQYNKERGLNQAEYDTLSSDDLNRFTAQTQANLGNYGALTANDLNQFSALSSDDLNRYGAELSKYGMDKNFLAQLLGGVAGPTNPQYQPYAQATPYQAPDLLGAMQGQYQGNLNKANAKNASSSQNMQTVGTIAAAAATAF